MKHNNKKNWAMGGLLAVLVIGSVVVFGMNGQLFQGNLGSLIKNNNINITPGLSNNTNPTLPTLNPLGCEKIEVDGNGKVHRYACDGHEIGSNSTNNSSPTYTPCLKGVQEGNNTLWSYCGITDFNIGYQKFKSNGQPTNGTLNVTRFPVITRTGGINNSDFVHKLADQIKIFTSGNDGRKYFKGKVYSDAYTAGSIDLQFTLLPDSLLPYNNPLNGIVIGSVGEGITSVGSNTVAGTGNTTYGINTLNNIKKIEFELKNNQVMRFENFTGIEFKEESTTQEDQTAVQSNAPSVQGTGTGVTICYDVNGKAMPCP